jgi:uncharacterized membrane protein
VLATPGDRNSSASSVNARGEAVGWFESSKATESGDPARHACLWRKSGVVDLNSCIVASAGWVLNEAGAINDRGQIAGHGTKDGAPMGFLLTPITPRVRR